MRPTRKGYPPTAGVAACEGTKSADALTSTAGGASRACKFLSLPETLDLPSLKAGRLPQTADECLADGMLYSEQDLGQKIVLSEENDDDTLGQFTRREFTIVGIAKSVLYINYERGQHVGRQRIAVRLRVRAAGGV